MGYSLIAIVTAALLVPGVIATQFFFNAGRSAGVDVVVPKMTSQFGLALTGTLSILVHGVFALILLIAATYPCDTGLPLANPYLLLMNGGDAPENLAQFVSMLWGFVLLLPFSALIGTLIGGIFVARSDKTVFYGPLAKLITATAADNAFILAYVMTNVETAFGTLSYRGIVESMKRDDEGYPAKLVLTAVRPFYLGFDENGPCRRESDLAIDTLVIERSDWRNVALVPIELEC